MIRTAQPTFDELANWLARERISRNLSIRKLARQAGLSHTVLADAEKGLGLSVNACKTLASFFGVAQVTILTLAGHIDQGAEPDGALMGQIVQEGNALAEADQREVLEFIRLKTRMKGAAADAKDKHPKRKIVKV